VSRIEDLRRRLQQDPASIAFAQLAEEHRRVGEYADAIRISREGLARHPTYASARVTLARALVATGDLDAAETEFETARGHAPDTLAAARDLAGLHARRGRVREALTAYREALALSPRDPELHRAVAELAERLGVDQQTESTAAVASARGGERQNSSIEESKKSDAGDGGHAQRVIARLEQWLEVVRRR
jgi:tetratricopeptide (TPR) repeat protein